MSENAFVQVFLEHHGIKGMKWGVRKKRPASTGPEKVTVTKTPGKRVKTSGGRQQHAHPDAVKAAINKQKARKSTTDSLSNAELKALINRMQMEQQYATIVANSSSLKRGQDSIKNILGLGESVNQALKFANSPAGKAIRSSLK